VEEHRDEDQIARLIERPPARAHRAEHDQRDRGESANGVSQRGERRKRVDRADVSAPAPPADAAPAMLALVFSQFTTPKHPAATTRWARSRLAHAGVSRGTARSNSSLSTAACGEPVEP